MGSARDVGPFEALLGPLRAGSPAVSAWATAGRSSTQAVPVCARDRFLAPGHPAERLRGMVLIEPPQVDVRKPDQALALGAGVHGFPRRLGQRMQRVGTTPSGARAMNACAQSADRAGMSSRPCGRR